jgi:hypothetical protein
MGDSGQRLHERAFSEHDRTGALRKRVGTPHRHRQFLLFLRQGDVNDTFEIAEILLGDDHDLIHKATGGWLRDAGKKDRQRLLRFLDGYTATMPRTMLRYAIEHLDGEQRAHYPSLKQATEAGQNRGGDRS